MPKRINGTAVEAPEVVERETSVWVPIDMLVPHPANPNKMDAAEQEKIRRHIETTGRYPPLTVRSLEETVAFEAERVAGKLQILDGQHRWLIQRDRGVKEIEVRIWRNVTDEQALIYLATLNNLRGEDDPTRRRSLISGLAEVMDVNELGQFLPENAEEIAKIVSERAEEAVERARERMRSIGNESPLTIFVKPEHEEAIRGAIKRWLDKYDPGHDITDCREGEALAGICKGFDG